MTKPVSVFKFVPAPLPGEKKDPQAMGYLRTEYFAGLVIHHLWSGTDWSASGEILTTGGDRIPVDGPYFLLQDLRELGILPQEEV